MNPLMKRSRFLDNNRGSMIIGLIAAITLIGIISAGTIYIKTSATQTGLFSNAYSSAYYLAESGIRYARLNAEQDTFFPASTQFNMSNGDTFIIQTANDPADASRMIIDSTGIVNPGAWSESKCDLTANVPKSIHNSNFTDVGLTVTTISSKGSIRTTLDPRWTITGAYTKASKLLKTASKGAIDYIEFTNEKVKNSKGTYIFDAILLSLGWWKSSPENPDLDQSWSDNDELLSYEVQMKVKLSTEDHQNDHFMHGISFRLSPQNPDWADSSTIHSYGISYFRSIDSNWPFNVGLDSSFSTIMNDPDPYIVLWEKTDSTNALSLIDYKKLASDDGVLDGTNLKEWSTIAVRIEEKKTGFASTTNYISGYIQSPEGLPIGTINWNFNTFNDVSWNTNIPQPIADESLTTNNFSFYKPDEIGIHAFFESDVDKLSIADFRLKLDASTESPYQW